MEAGRDKMGFRISKSPKDITENFSKEDVIDSTDFTNNVESENIAPEEYIQKSDTRRDQEVKNETGRIVRRIGALLRSSENIDKQELNKMSEVDNFISNTDVNDLEDIMKKKYGTFIEYVLLNFVLTDEYNTESKKKEVIASWLSSELSLTSPERKQEQNLAMFSTPTEENDEIEFWFSGITPHDIEVVKKELFIYATQNYAISSTLQKNEEYKNSQDGFNEEGRTKEGKVKMDVKNEDGRDIEDQSSLIRTNTEELKVRRDDFESANDISQDVDDSEINSSSSEYEGIEGLDSYWKEIVDYVIQNYNPSSIPEKNEYKNVQDGFNEEGKRKEGEVKMNAKKEGVDIEVQPLLIGSNTEEIKVMLDDFESADDISQVVDESEISSSSSEYEGLSGWYRLGKTFLNMLFKIILPVLFWNKNEDKNLQDGFNEEGKRIKSQDGCEK